jgi:PadR family transcriptional regulator AphA
LSSADWATLACVVERPAHGFAVASRLAPAGDLGRVVTVSRSLTYRSIARLLDHSLVEVVGEERGRNGLTRTIYAATVEGRAALGQWLGEAVEAAGDVRTDLLLKVVILDLLGLDASELLTRQREILTREVAALERAGDADDAVAVWWMESTRAALRFVERVDLLDPAADLDPATDHDGVADRGGVADPS